MAQDISQLPDYANPPVIEVVFGVQFKELKGLGTPYVGRFWGKLGKDEYPTFQEMPDLPHIIEKEVLSSSQDQPEIKAYPVPPLPRIFFIDKNKNHLVQLQRDRLLMNWRKLTPESEYPRYKTLFPRFESTLSNFIGFMSQENIGVVEPDQYELTYVNHIIRKDEWKSLENIQLVFPGFHCCSDGAFLPEPEKVSWRRIYKLPENSGRLYATMNQAINGMGQQVYVLNMTARGYGQDGCKKWFDLAHGWIVRGFTDLTGENIQGKVWGKK